MIGDHPHFATPLTRILKRMCTLNAHSLLFFSSSSHHACLNAITHSPPFTHPRTCTQKWVLISGGRQSLPWCTVMEALGVLWLVRISERPSARWERCSRSPLSLGGGVMLMELIFELSLQIIIARRNTLPRSLTWREEKGLFFSVKDDLFDTCASI